MTDPNLDRRKVWWAVLASIVAHFLIGLSLAAFGGGQQDIALEEQQVPQLTIVQAPEPTPPPVVPKNAPMTTVDPARKSAVAPKEKTFEANENSIAAAEKAATTDNQLPGQDGKERPFMNLEEHKNSFTSGGSTPQPKPTPTAAPKETPTPNETVPPTAATPAPDQLALLTQTPCSGPFPAGIGRENGDSHARGNADSNAGTDRNSAGPGLQLPRFPAENGHPRRDQQSRPLGSKCGGHAAGAIQEAARGRDWVALVLLYGGEDRLDQYRYDCGDV